MSTARSFIIGCVAAATLIGCTSGAASELRSPSITASTEPPAVVTTYPPPTAAPTTTTVPDDEQVRVDFGTAVLARDHCTADPTTCDFAAIAVAASPMDVETRNLVAMRMQLNLRTKPGFGEVTTTVEETSVVGDTALLTTCSYDTATLFDIGDPANPDDDTVFDDSQYSSRMQWEMSRVGGKWLVVSGTELARSPGGALCAA